MRSSADALRPIVALLAVIAVGALPPHLVAIVYARELPDMSIVEAFVGTAELVATAEWASPAQAYPERVRGQMPDGLSWWLVLLVPLGVVVGGGAVALASLDVVVARRVLGRRPYDLRGSRPREWARPRDVKALQIARRSGRRMTLGRLDGRLLAADPEAMALLCAPPRSGKTTGFIVPWLLEHDGPALVTSTKRDVWQVTHERRERGGETWVYDPFSPGSCCWDPLDGCQEWGGALRRARGLADAATRPGPASHVEEFWGDEAAKLLAPFLHAAAVSERSMGQVLTWLESADRREPVDILRSSGDPAAQSQLEGVLSLDPRNEGTTFMSTAHLLHAYRYPEVAATTKPGFTAADLLDGDAGTLYLTSAASHQRMLAPLLVALVSSVIEAAIQKSRDEDRPLDPLLRILLDETANIAPLQSLPAHLSDTAAYGIRIATCWQTVSQMRARYGDAKDTIVGASTAKVFMGPITDRMTAEEISGLLGQRPVPVDDHSVLGPKASPAELQQFAPPRALVVAGTLPPAIVRSEPYWRIPEFREP